jgi:hypothetical protein
MIKNIVKNTITALTALVGLVGGVVWAFKSNWDFEPVILIIISFLEVVGFIVLKSLSERGTDESEDFKTAGAFNNHVNEGGDVKGAANFGNNNTINIIKTWKEADLKPDKEKRIEDIRSAVSILFIDDDTKFKVIAILKNAGWIKTRIIKDLKNLNDESILNAHIVFVDIQGVGKLMGFNDGGLGLAASIKERYAKKKVIIYSADSEGSRFHKAFRIADDQLSKNAVPYEFESVIETMTTQLIIDGVL